MATRVGCTGSTRRICIDSQCYEVSSDSLEQPTNDNIHKNSGKVVDKATKLEENKTDAERERQLPRPQCSALDPRIHRSVEIIEVQKNNQKESITNPKNVGGDSARLLEQPPPDSLPDLFEYFPINEESMDNF